MMTIGCILVFLLVVFLVPNGNEWLLQQGRMAQAFLYHFFHGNIFHLLANSLSLYVIVPRSKTWHLIAAYAIASLSALLISSPIIGISNIVYALIGVRTPSFDSWWWRHPGTMIFFAVTLLMLFLPNVAGLTHIICFVAGLVISIANRTFSRIKKDVARYV